jgi:putative chitinase
MNWRDFFSDLFSGDHPKDGLATATMLRPGTVMICFVNRYLEALDGVKYKIHFDGHELAGVTTATSYCFEVQPTTLNPVKVSVWSRKSKTFKALDDVVPVLGQCKLVRKVLATAKVTSRTEKHPDTKPANAPAPSLPPPPPPGPSPVDGQGVVPKPARNEKDEPQTQAARPVPGGVTVTQLRKIFTDSKRATDAYLQSIANEVNANLVTFKLDTPLRRAHFFSQVKGETGNSMQPVRESWEYSPEALMSFSDYYRAHPKEAEQDGYLKDPKNPKKFIRHADQNAIGRKHFLHLNDNRLDHPDDGSNFRGRGLLQITGYGKYSLFRAEYSQYWSGPLPNCVDDPELIVKYPYSIRSAIWFWMKYKVYEVADKGATHQVVAKVTKRVNGGDNGLKERREAFDVAYPAFK